MRLSKSSYVSKSRKTLELWFSFRLLKSILTKTAYFLKFPVFAVMSSMYLEVKSPLHRSPESRSSASTDTVSPLWAVTVIW